MNKEIFLKKLIIRNFKGIRSLTIDFNQQETTIAGENGTGKTTVLDAFLWLLFGKDSTNRSDINFNIKTLDENGKPILKLEHEVTGVLSVNGNEVTLKRIYLEKWEKPRGTSQEILKNHYTDYYLNGVKLATKKEYEAEVSAIIPEDVFKMITNPFYFNTRTAAEQKAMLMDMAGDVTDEDVQALKPEYSELLKQISGKSLEMFKKEIAAKKKAIKDELEQIPARIDTANQLMPEPEQWDKLESELKSKRLKVTEIENQITDKSKIVEAEYKRKAEIQRLIGDKRMERTKLENNIRAQATSDNNKARTSINEISFKIQSLQRDIENKKGNITIISSQIANIDTELETLRGQYRTISADQLQYPEGVFECPTCKRPLEADDIEAKQAELLANFNETKSKRLQSNKNEGMEKSSKKNELQKKKESLLAEISELENQVTTLTGQKQYQEDNIPSAQDADALIQANEEWIRLGNEISELENQLSIESKPVDTSDLRNSKMELETSIQEINKRLTKRDAIERSEKLIKDLEESRTTNNLALADLERMEFIALDFQKAKDNELMKRINGMFSLVSFSFVDEQLNGGEKLTCVCTVNGTPYPDVNNAGKINAGLDIINAICLNKGVTAPIFIDNREGVNELLSTNSQVINLVVLPKIYECPVCHTRQNRPGFCINPDCDCDNVNDITPKGLIIN